jgi:hypothetical protein
MFRHFAWASIFAAISAAALTISAGFARATQPTEQPPLPAEKTANVQTHKWEFGISVRATAGPCNTVVGTFPVPADWPEQQVKVASQQISPGIPRHNYRQIDGLKQMVFDAPQIAQGGTAECFITFEVTKHEQLPPQNTDNLIVPKNLPNEIKKFLNPSPLIEATNTKVRSLAKELTDDKESAWQQVKSIQAGVREKVKYEPNPKDKNKGVFAVLRDGKADREDLNATFVAVCRAAKIPARMVWSVDFCYAEFYLEDAPAAAEDNADSSEEKAEKPAAKDKKTKQPKGPKGTWYPCVMQDEKAELGGCKDYRPILGKGDNFKVPEEKMVQRWVNLFWSAKGAAKPAAEFRLRNAD